MQKRNQWLMAVGILGIITFFLPIISVSMGGFGSVGISGMQVLTSLFSERSSFGNPLGGIDSSWDENPAATLIGIFLGSLLFGMTLISLVFGIKYIIHSRSHVPRKYLGDMIFMIILVCINSGTILLINVAMSARGASGLYGGGNISFWPSFGFFLSAVVMIAPRIIVTRVRETPVAAETLESPNEDQSGPAPGGDSNPFR